MNFDYEERSNKALIQKILKEVLIWGIEIALVVALAYSIIHFAVEKTEMVGSSMESTLSAGDEVIINKMAYRFHDPVRNDVVVFKQSNKEHSYYNIKRIIGLPGETIQIKDNRIFIDGEPKDDIIVAEAMSNAGLAEEPITLDENEYFVLGDNRNNSEDSRFANVGNIISDEIVGKAWFKVKPFSFVSELNLKANQPVSE